MTIPVGYQGNQWGGFWRESDNSGPYFLSPDGTMGQGVPAKLFTDDDGPYARLRVDVGQTGFWAGREFRAVSEFTLASGVTQVYRLQCAVDSVLQLFSVMVTIGEIRVEAAVGGTPGGTFGTSVTIFPTNGMSTASGYVGQSTLDTGGTHTGGALRDLMLILAGTGNRASTQLVTSEDPIGRAAVPLYVRITNTDGGTVKGVIKLRWEERP